LRYWKRGKMIGKTVRQVYEERKSKLEEEMKDAPEWKQRQIESKLYMLKRRMMPTVVWAGGTYKKERE